MDKYLEVVNETTDMHELCDVGGIIGCFIACVGGCLVAGVTMSAIVALASEL